MPVRDERGLYERISLEAFQAELSWATILCKCPAFRAAFDDFDPDRIAGYGDTDVERLMADAGIVRNRAKILAAVANARATVRLREHGGLTDLVWGVQATRHPQAAHVRRDSHHLPPIAGPVQSAARTRARVRRPDHHAHALMEAIGVIDTHLLDSHRRGSSGIWPA
ncbi:DNA-3-methyladenine glycosylase I [Kitasatospora sp. NPDC087271]|uniref:DNA-3-methyladenine glycosylase I n=1 Tax=Kitasatospora sp. NPDC087271 TaxID=3364067 RepID=UPI003801839C